MNAVLLKQFIEEEGTPYVCHLLKGALEVSTSPSKRFEFNRFEGTIDHERYMVLVDDILDATDAGVLRVPLEEFATALMGQLA